MALRLADGTAWSDVLARAVAATGEAFGAEVDGVTTLHNLVEGEWRATGQPAPVRTPVDNTVVINLRRLDADTARAAVLHAAAEHRTWARTPLADRKARVADALDSLTAHRDLLALLLVWEIGKPWRLACADVDRALDGVRWYADEIDRMLAGGREPLPGPVSNIASWNYPMSVLVHAELVQLLAGNAVIAKTPSQGGAVCLTVAHALMRRAGLPVTLVSGGGAELSEVLVRAPEIGARRVRRRTLQRRQGRRRAARHRQAALHRAGGPQRLGHLELLPVGPARRAPARRASSTASSAAPRTPGSWCSVTWSTSSSTCTCRSSARCASVTRSPSATTGPPETRCPSSTSGR